jgi:hypothetical protein
MRVSRHGEKNLITSGVRDVRRARPAKKNTKPDHVFNEISAQIGGALERLGHENWIGTQSYVRQ